MEGAAVEGDRVRRGWESKAICIWLAVAVVGPHKSAASFLSSLPSSFLLPFFGSLCLLSACCLSIYICGFERDTERGRKREGERGERGI